jgi:HAD superfamily hydrolase (TIGR01509 family)
VTTSARRAIEAVVFDLDGTLLDSMSFAPQVYATTVRDLGGPALSAETVVSRWHIGPAPVLLAHLLDRAVGPDDMECYHRNFAAAVADVRPFPGISALIDELRGSGYGIAIYTSAIRHAASRMLAQARLDAHFPVIVCGDEVGRPKPDPQGLRLACRRLGVDPVEAAYVGDAAVDLQCASAAGSLGIHARWGGRAATTNTGTGLGFAIERPHDVMALLRRQGSLSPVQDSPAQDSTAARRRLSPRE